MTGRRGHVGMDALLRDWRERNGLTQARAAELLGVSLRSLQEWEHGRRPGRSVDALVRRLVAVLDQL